ncbi:hypothetical protein M5K25_002632 [Dendrobium thyrsiflorum]|uniref:Myb/SANT-like domain-containing protein n=1 Tax=Dendrobium thyrsiflorum TaxID=117978 RepID=A0ABD0VN23_DENTH
MRKTSKPSRLSANYPAFVILVKFGDHLFHFFVRSGSLATSIVWYIEVAQTQALSHCRGLHPLPPPISLIRRSPVRSGSDERPQSLISLCRSQTQVRRDFPFGLASSPAPALAEAAGSRPLRLPMGKPKDGGPSAIWERDVKIIFCDLCLKEIELGNRPTTHFNKECWMNLIKSFQEKTGREYDKTQLKNKWDQLKKDWKLWKELKRDPELEDKLDMMFMRVVATGAHAWTPNQAVEHSDVGGYSEQFDNVIDSSESPLKKTDDLSDSNHSKRKSTSTSKTRKKKKYGSAFLRNQISQLVSACTNIGSASNVSQSTSYTPLLSDAIKVLNQIEVFEEIPLYLYSTKLLEDPIKREVFMSMLPERRIYYLRYCYENRDV